MTAPTIHICPVCGEDDGLDEQECRRVRRSPLGQRRVRPAAEGRCSIEAAAQPRQRSRPSPAPLRSWRRLRRCRCSYAPENPGATRSRKRARVPAPAVLAALEGGR